MDNSFRAYCKESPTMQTIISNRNLWRINIVMFFATIMTLLDAYDIPPGA